MHQKQRLVTSGKIMAMYNISAMKLHRMRKAGLPCMQLDGNIYLYDIDQVEEWIAERYEIRGIYHYEMPVAVDGACLSTKKN